LRKANPLEDKRIKIVDMRGFEDGRKHEEDGRCDEV
jgi:hypothetical protein